MNKKATLSIIILLSTVITASAEIYTWRDNKGNVYATNEVSKVPKIYQDQIEEHDDSGTGNYKGIDIVFKDCTVQNYVLTITNMYKGITRLPKISPDSENIYTLDVINRAKEIACIKGIP